MTDLHAPAHARRRISALPHQLKPGDVIRDWGIERTVATVIHQPGIMHVDLVRFEPVFGYPPSLGIDAGVTVTAWRMDA